MFVRRSLIALAVAFTFVACSAVSGRKWYAGWSDR